MRETGATDEQIEILARWQWSKWPSSQEFDPSRSGGISWEQLSDVQKEHQREIARERYLSAVPPSHAIVAKADLRALVEWRDAVLAFDEAQRSDEDMWTPDLRDATERMRKAQNAITPDLLERVKKGCE